MANTIKFKRGSGSDPGTSDLSVGEIAIRTDTAKIFTKNDGGSVVEISGGIEDGDKGDITVSSSGATFTIDNDAVTYAKIQNVSATDRLLGRDSSGAGIIEEIAPSAVRTMLGLAASATTDTTNASNISSGTISDDRLPATISSDITGSAATLTNARSIAGTSFNGSASIDIDYNNLTNLPTIPSNTNQLTNGAGFITATLTEEQVEDFVGGMVSGNTETGITVTYQDSDGTLDFVVASQTDENFTTTLKNKLDGIATGATNVTNNNQLTNGAGYITATLTNEQVQDIVGGMLTRNTETGITVTYQDGDGTIDFVVGTLNQDTTGNAATATALETARNIGGVSFDGTANINLPGVNTAGNQNTTGTSGGFTAGSASNLNSGTLPDARFPSTLPAVDGSNLTGISAGATGGGSDEVFYENDQAVTTNYTITNGKNAMAAGPITINSGVTVTVGSGETLTIV